MQPILDAIAATSPAAIAKYAALGAAAGAIVMPLIIYFGLKFNLKRLRTIFDSAAIPKTAGLYRISAAMGAALFGIVTGSQPVLDAAGENEVYIRAALLPVILLVVLWPFARALRRLRERGG
jgi:hypothetical protein